MGIFAQKRTVQRVIPIKRSKSFLQQTFNAEFTLKHAQKLVDETMIF